MKYIIITLIMASILSCGVEKNNTANFKVQYDGALKNMMHKGDITAKADLKVFENTEHFYALGAIENLKGEIQIFDSRPFITSVMNDSLTFDNSFSQKATLLVYAFVNHWKSIEIPDNILTYEQLERFIEETAKKNQIKIDEPFPFMIEGKVMSFDWHVIDWKDGDKKHSHEKHINSGLHGTLNNRDVQMLGFYSDSHHAIFTHHTTNMHIHVKTVDNKLAGHVDGLSLGKEMILKLPDLN